jgi:hypothetical protein
LRKFSDTGHPDSGLVLPKGDGALALDCLVVPKRAGQP